MRDVAEKLGVSPQYISAILNGKKSISDNFVRKVVEFTGKTFDETTTDDGEQITGDFMAIYQDMANDKNELYKIIADLREILKNVTK